MKALAQAKPAFRRLGRRIAKEARVSDAVRLGTGGVRA